MRRIELLILLFTSAFLCPAAHAQHKEAVAYRHSLELTSGVSAGVFGYKGEEKTSLGLAAGVNTGLRYTCFFRNGWGAYASLSMEALDAGETEFFGVVNKADGGRYLYRFSGYGDYSPTLDPLISAGAAYRWSKGRFSFVPRAGIGLADYYGADYSIERRSRDGKQGPEYLSLGILGKSETVDYLIDTRHYETIPPVFVLSGSFQVSCSLGRRMNVFVEPGFNAVPYSMKASLTTVRSKNEYEPINWVEAVAYDNAKDRWVRDNDSAVSKNVKSGVPVFFHLNVGLGISFGR